MEKLYFNNITYAFSSSNPLLEENDGQSSETGNMEVVYSTEGQDTLKDDIKKFNSSENKKDTKLYQVIIGEKGNEDKAEQQSTNDSEQSAGNDKQTSSNPQQEQSNQDDKSPIDLAIEAFNKIMQIF